jgi:hypothetical protein
MEPMALLFLGHRGFSDGPFLSADAEDHACVPCLRRSGFAQAGETLTWQML